MNILFYKNITKNKKLIQQAKRLVCVLPNKTIKKYGDFMDRRQRKTRTAIFNAFFELLKTKRYDRITVGEIIERADVGRSTFYAHFETKDLLINALCDDLFNHIFYGDGCEWNGKDNSLESRLSHILWHIKDDKKGVSKIIISDSTGLFMNCFKIHLRKVFREYLSDFKMDVPESFLLNHLVGGFSETVKWWLEEDMKTSPENMAKYFISMTEKH